MIHAKNQRFFYLFITLQLKASAIFETVSVTSYVSLPGLTSRSAASLARYAAIMASAFRPVNYK